jgi:hypothetical protein
MTRGEFFAIVGLVFAIFAALTGMLLVLVIDAHQNNRKNAEDILKLEKQIFEMRCTRQPVPAETSAVDSKPRRKNNRRRQSQRRQVTRR